MRFEAGDIFMTRGTSFVSRAIRFFTRRTGESRTKVNHVGVFVGDGDKYAEIVEALTTVKRRRIVSYWDDPSTEVAVFRSRDLTDDQIRRLTARASRYVGAKYGYFKIVAHFLDWCLGGVYLFRRLARMDRYPICSWVVAYAYDSVGVQFGVPPWVADPDDIWDWCVEHFECVHPLEVLR